MRRFQIVLAIVLVLSTAAMAQAFSPLLKLGEMLFRNKSVAYTPIYRNSKDCRLYETSILHVTGWERVYLIQTEYPIDREIKTIRAFDYDGNLLNTVRKYGDDVDILERQRKIFTSFAYGNDFKEYTLLDPDARIVRTLDVDPAGECNFEITENQLLIWFNCDLSYPKEQKVIQVFDVDGNLLRRFDDVKRPGLPFPYKRSDHQNKTSLKGAQNTLPLVGQKRTRFTTGFTRYYSPITELMEYRILKLDCAEPDPYRARNVILASRMKLIIFVDTLSTMYRIVSDSGNSTEERIQYKFIVYNFKGKILFSSEYSSHPPLILEKAGRILFYNNLGTGFPSRFLLINKHGDIVNTFRRSDYGFHSLLFYSSEDERIGWAYNYAWPRDERLTVFEIETGVVIFDANVPAPGTTTITHKGKKYVIHIPQPMQLEYVPRSTPPKD